MLRSRVLRLIALAAWAAGSAGSALGAGGNPLVGIWVLNRHKSDFHGDPGYASQVMTVTDAGAGVLHYAFDTVGSDGRSSHVEYDTKSDGKPHPITNSASFDSNTSQLLGPRTVKRTVMKSGNPVAWGADKVSGDGKTKSENWQHDGKLYSYRLVFDRQIGPPPG